MRRLTTVLLATCLVGTSAVPAIAQEPSPSVPATMYADDYLRLADELLEELHDSDVRYEFPEAGIALTFPGHWLTRESELGWGTLAEAQSLAEPLFCYLQAAQVARDDASASGAAEALTARYEGEGHPAVMRTRVLVPAGEAWRVDAEAESGPLTVYVVMSGRTLVALHCIAVDTERPADRWLSIAETLEFLPVGEPGAGQHPREGRPFQTTDFAVRFPDEWTVDEITPETHGWLYSKAGSDERIWSGVVYAHDAEFSCAVIDTTDYAHEHDLKSIDDAVAWELQAFSDDLDDPGRASCSG